MTGLAEAHVPQNTLSVHSCLKTTGQIKAAGIVAFSWPVLKTVFQRLCILSEGPHRQ